MGKLVACVLALGLLAAASCGKSNGLLPPPAAAGVPLAATCAGTPVAATEVHSVVACMVAGTPGLASCSQQ